MPSGVRAEEGHPRLRGPQASSRHTNVDLRMLVWHQHRYVIRVLVH